LYNCNGDGSRNVDDGCIMVMVVKVVVIVV
jgi:hypothetical protein